MPPPSLAAFVSCVQTEKYENGDSSVVATIIIWCDIVYQLMLCSISCEWRHNPNPDVGGSNFPIFA